jgi:hypothetical protein
LARHRPGRTGHPGRVGARAPARRDVWASRRSSILPRRALLDSIDTSTVVGLRDRALIGIMAFLKNGGTLEKAVAMANHASTRTTQLYDRRRDELSLDEVERIVI